MPGRYNDEPMPSPVAPAASQAPMFERSTPPTGMSPISRGTTAVQALRPSNPTCAAGKILMRVAPAPMALNASLGVAVPGRLCIPSSRVSVMTPVSVFGETMIWAPASWHSRTCSAVSTVPAPTRQSSGSRARRVVIERRGSGEFSGTSTVRSPASYRQRPTAAASDSVRPLRIAIKVAGSCSAAVFIDEPLEVGSGVEDGCADDEPGCECHLPHPDRCAIAPGQLDGNAESHQGPVVSVGQVGVAAEEDRAGLVTEPRCGEPRDLVADEQAGDVVLDLVGRESAGHRERAR